MYSTYVACRKTKATSEPSSWNNAELRDNSILSILSVSNTFIIQVKKWHDRAQAYLAEQPCSAGSSSRAWHRKHTKQGQFKRAPIRCKYNVQQYISNTQCQLLMTQISSLVTLKYILEWNKSNLLVKFNQINN